MKKFYKAYNDRYWLYFQLKTSREQYEASGEDTFCWQDEFDYILYEIKVGNYEKKSYAFLYLINIMKKEVKKCTK